MDQDLELRNHEMMVSKSMQILAGSSTKTNHVYETIDLRV